MPSTCRVAGILAAILVWHPMTVQAQPVSAEGRWQGTVTVNGEELRMVIRLEPRQNAPWRCLVNWIEREIEAFPCSSVAVDGHLVTVAVAEAGGLFEGQISADEMRGTYRSPTVGTQQLRFERTSPQDAWVLDPAPHQQHYVTVDDGARVEVLDFGGDGPPMVFVSGLGPTAHVFDDFIPHLTENHRVIALTRRGFGESDRPAGTAANYNTRRMADDVVAVMDDFDIDRAVLVGWSAGGAELSSVAHRFPQRVAGLVYLDAAYDYAFYAPGNLISRNNPAIMANDLKARLSNLRAVPLDERVELLDDILRNDLPDLAYDLAAARDDLIRNNALFPPSYEPPPPPPPPPPVAPVIAAAPPLPPRTLAPPGEVADAITGNFERFGPLPVPVLALYARNPIDEDADEPFRLANEMFVRAQSDVMFRFRDAHPDARVLMIPDAGHDIFLTNTEEVLAEMITFMESLEW